MLVKDGRRGQCAEGRATTGHGNDVEDGVEILKQGRFS